LNVRGETPFSRKGRQYMNLTRRRLMLFEEGEEEKSFLKFKSTLCDIKELSMIMQSLIM
jgi:hypothetical protein